MTGSTQLTSRETLDVIIRHTISVYRWAVYVSFAMLGAGFLIAVIGDQNIGAEMAGPARLVRLAIDFQAAGFIGLGIGVMVLAPIVMIASAAVGFLQAGDRRYAWVTLAVAAILTLSIVISFVTG